MLAGCQLIQCAACPLACACAPQQGELFAQQEAQLGDDKLRLRQHVREQELSSEELIKQFRWVVRRGCLFSSLPVPPSLRNRIRPGMHPTFGNEIYEQTATVLTC